MWSWFSFEIAGSEMSYDIPIIIFIDTLSIFLEVIYIIFLYSKTHSKACKEL